MRNYKEEFEKRTAFIRSLAESSGARGIIYGNSGGKDSALVGALCKAACPDTVGIIMPCESKRNFGEDKDDAIIVAKHFGIGHRTVDLTAAKAAIVESLKGVAELNDAALTNIAPRLRMTTLYAIAAAEGRLVAGTGNRSERYMGYFTKYGDGGCDFNPIADLTVREIYEFLTYLGAPECVIKKAPSAGLFEGQTDEAEMGVTYDSIDDFLLFGKVSDDDRAVIERYHKRSAHKLKMPAVYEDKNDA